MNLLDLKQKIKFHLVAGYPGLYIHSGEDARIDAMLREVSADLALSPKEWNLGYGWVDFFNKQPRTSQNQNVELANSLPELLDDDLDGKLFIIKDARGALENQPLGVARLKQLLNRIQRHHRGKSAVLLVAETVHIPASIEAQVTLLPLSLPHGDEIQDQVEKSCTQLKMPVPNDIRQRLHAACSGLTQEEIHSALAIVRIQYEQINDDALALIQREKEQIIAKSGVLEMIKVSESASDIGGLENLKEWLGRRSQIFGRLDEAQASGIQAPKGVLIAGMPGCGKSLTAKAAASLFQLPLLRLDIGALLGKYVGESEHNMRRALTMAESVSPCILWIDELEKAFVGMNSGSGSEVSSRLFGYFLTWMQEKNGAVFVIATANNITALPPELLRKGRFDEVFYVGFPNVAERSAILTIHLKNEASSLSSDQHNSLVAQCRDYAGADIQNAINEARESAFLNRRGLRFEDLDEAIKRTVPLRETLRDQVGRYEELFDKLRLKSASAYQGLSMAQMIRMADDPNQIKREQVANHPECPDDLLEKLSKDSHVAVQRAVYQNPRCPERVLTLRLNVPEGADKYDGDLLLQACLNPNAPIDLLTHLLTEKKLDKTVRVALAKGPNGVGLASSLMADAEAVVRTALAGVPGLSEETQQRLSTDKVPDVLRALAQNPDVTRNVLGTILQSLDSKERVALASLDRLSEMAWYLLVEDGDKSVRLALASNKFLPDYLQVRLAGDDSPDVVASLATNPALIEAAREKLGESEHPNVHALMQFAYGLDEDALAEKLKSKSAKFRVQLASMATLPMYFQILLAKDENLNVRLALARNPQLRGAALAILKKSTNLSIRQALNPSVRILSSAWTNL
jgi:ATP-dependent 26S proteasome regulatory subunit